MAAVNAGRPSRMNMLAKLKAQREKTAVTKMAVVLAR